MPFTPAHISAVRGTRGTFDGREQAQWKENLNQVKRLYLDRKYKHCAALCNETLSKKVAHPLHETSLQFFTAICYESLGSAAHNYSVQKLPFLNLAKDKFAAALATLPLPSYSNEKEHYGSLEVSPQVTEFSSSPLSILNTASPTPQLSGSTAPTSDTSSTSSDEDDDDVHDTVPDFSKYTRRQFTMAVDKGDSDHPVTLFRPSRDHKARLSQSLSTNHVIEEGLIPNPLFGMQRKTFVSDAPSAPRPLPPIPSRDPVLRKTALQTVLNPCAITHIDSSPETPRLSQIRDAFTPKLPHHEHLHAYLTSYPLSRYNEHLASFRTKLLTHLATVADAIETTAALQREHKRNKTSRLASYWSIKPEDVEGKERKDRIARLRKEGWKRVTKERHGWKGIEHYETLRASALGDLRD